MKFEIKTQNDDYTKSFFTVFLIFGAISSFAIISNISIKLGKISRYYEINYYCKRLTIDKSSTNFKKLSKLINQTSKEKIWFFCREIIK
tara:strand:+ start:156 stop:422 length:267 start_codon:yes stop_codon:yes gene_type:complete